MIHIVQFFITTTSAQHTHSSHRLPCPYSCGVDIYVETTSMKHPSQAMLPRKTTRKKSSNLRPVRGLGVESQSMLQVHSCLWHEHVAPHPSLPQLGLHEQNHSKISPDDQAKDRLAHTSEKVTVCKQSDPRSFFTNLDDRIRLTQYSQEKINICLQDVPMQRSDPVFGSTLWGGMK